MKRRSLLPLAAVVAGLAFAGAGNSALAATTWAPTATRGLTLSGTLLGPAPSSTPLRVSVALKMQNKPALEDLIKSGQTITPDQFKAQFGATDSDAQAVASYLTSQGFSNVQIAPNNLFVSGKATAAKAAKAFNTQIVQYDVKGETLYANSAVAQVPSSLSGAVLSVLGLNDAAKMHTFLDVPPNYLVSYTPKQFWSAYDAAKSKTGAQTPIAIFAQGDVTGVVKNLRTEEDADGLARVPVTVVKVGPGSPDSSAALEWDMDTQFSAGMAGYVARLYLYDTTTLTDSDVTMEFNRFATDNLARAGSASFGECEYQAWADGAMVAMDQVFAQAAAQGQTVFASSGDTGGFCPVVPDNGVPAGFADVGYPASSQYVVSVGGTTLFTHASDGTYDDEIAWLAGGGGPSYFESQPYWQSGVVPPTNTCVNYVECLGKNLPDISMDADGNSGANVYTGGSSTTAVGGTSLSSPLALGVWARLQTTFGNTLGFAAPKLYGMYQTTGFHDITQGNTGPYEATPGWDFATGLGTFDVAQAKYAMKAVLHPPPAVVPPPACTDLTDPAGDAHPLASSGNVDSLDIRAMGFSSDGTNLTGVISVRALDSGPGGTPQIAGGGDVLFLKFVTTDATGTPTTRFLRATFGAVNSGTSPGTPGWTFSYGHVVLVGTVSNHTTDGNATGTVDTANGVITISVPLTVFGYTAGSVITGPFGETYELAGANGSGFLEAADTTDTGSSYTVGANC